MKNPSYDDLQNKCARITRCVDFLHRAARELEQANMQVEVMSIDTMIDMRERQLEGIIKKYFPKMELRKK